MSNRALSTRQSYQADAAFLAKLADAVQRDARFTAEQKREAVANLNKVSILFMQVLPSLSVTPIPVKKNVSSR